MNATYEPSISTSSANASTMGGAWTNSSTGPPTHAMTMQSASRPGSRCDSDRPSRFTTTNVFASRNTTSATVPNGMAAKPMSTSHGRSNWMDNPYSANRHSSRKYSALRNCRGSLR